MFRHIKIDGAGVCLFVRKIEEKQIGLDAISVLFREAFLLCIFADSRDRVANFGSHALLHEGTELALIIDLDDLLRPIGRVGDVELHLDGAARSRRRARVCRQVEVFRISSGIRLVEFLVV